jgi:hypothetical protein
MFGTCTFVARQLLYLGGPTIGTQPTTMGLGVATFTMCSFNLHKEKKSQMLTSTTNKQNFVDTLGLEITTRKLWQ